MPSRLRSLALCISGSGQPDPTAAVGRAFPATCDSISSAFLLLRFIQMHIDPIPQLPLTFFLGSPHSFANLDSYTYTFMSCVPMWFYVLVKNL